MTTLTFHDTELTIIDHNGQRWLNGTQIGFALGFANRQAVTKLYQRNKDEFNGDTSTTVNLTAVDGKRRKIRVFNRRGAHLIAMFAKTERAKEFRKWVLDVLEEKYSSHSTPQVAAVDTYQQPPLPFGAKSEAELFDTLSKQCHALRAMPSRRNTATAPCVPSADMLQEIRLAYLRSLDLVEALREVERVRSALHVHLDVCSRLVFPQGMPQPRKLVTHV